MTVQRAYVVSESYDEYSARWLSIQKNGSALTPQIDTLYMIMGGDNFVRRFAIWDDQLEQYFIVGEKRNTLSVSTLEKIEFEKAALHMDYSKEGDGEGRRQYSFPNVKVLPGCTKIVVTLTTFSNAVTGRTAPDLVTNVGSVRTALNATSSHTYLAENLGDVFTSKLVMSWGWNSVSNISIVQYVADGILETSEYVAPKESADGLSGLLPGISSEQETSVFLSNGKWVTIQELKEMLAI